MISIPTVSRFKNGDGSLARETDISAEFSKPDYPNLRRLFRLGLDPCRGRPEDRSCAASGTWKPRSSSSSSPSGERVRHVRRHGRGMGQHGRRIGGADPFSTITPTLYVGKGFGDLPDSAGWLRAFGVTGQVGYSIRQAPRQSPSIPTAGWRTSTIIRSSSSTAGSLQYSMPYLKSSIIRPRLARLHQPSDPNRRSAVCDTGRELFQYRDRDDRHRQSRRDLRRELLPGRLEAIIPVNRASGTSVGVMAQLHLYLDDMFPFTIGKPLFGSSTSSGRPPYSQLTMNRTPSPILGSLVFGTAYAHAHAFLDHAEPRVGNSVTSSPREVSLWFTQNLEAAFSTVEVRDASGARVDQASLKSARA